MGLAPPSGYDSSNKVPGFVIGVQFAAGSKSAGSAGMKLCLMGNMRTGGTATLDTPVFVASPDDGDAYFDPKSELARACRKVFDQFRIPALWATPVTESTGVAATATLLFATTATVSGSVKITVDGDTIEVAITAGDTGAVIAGNVNTAINAQTRWPVTSGIVGSTVTVTRANKGTRGNDKTIRVAFPTPIATTVALNGYVASATGASGMFGDTANAGPVAGTLTDNPAAALANMASSKFDHIAIANVDTSGVAAFIAYLNTYSGIAERKRQRGVTAIVKTLANAITDSALRNALLVQNAWHYNADDSSLDIAAQAAAGRIYGDGQVAGGIGTSRGELAYRAANLDGTMLASIKAQVVVADQPLGTESKQALDHGLTPLVPSVRNPGFVEILRSITSRYLDAQGNPNYAVLDTTKVEVIHYAADRFEAFGAATFPNKNLIPEPTGALARRHPDSVIPSEVKSAFVAEMYRMQDEGLCVNVADHVDEIQFQIDPNNGGLLLGFIPYAVINGLHNMATTLAQVG